MTYQRTQIYLDPDDHRRLVEEARRRGVSLAALLREIVHERFAPRSAPDGEGFQALVGIIDTGELTDIAHREDAYKADALDARYRKKMGEAVGDRSRRRRRAPKKRT